MSAATPSQAAELLVADDQVGEHTSPARSPLGRAVKHLLVQQREQLGQLRRRLGEPRRQLLECEQRFDELGAAAERPYAGACASAACRCAHPPLGSPTATGSLPSAVAMALNR